MKINRPKTPDPIDEFREIAATILHCVDADGAASHGMVRDRDRARDRDRGNAVV